MLTSVSSFAQNANKVDFETKSQSFDSIPEGTQLKIVYRFTNNGTTDFQLTKVAPTCGCTVAEFPKYPILPGAQDSIVATFDTNHRLGQQAKGVNLESNRGEINLIFLVNVIPGEATKANELERAKAVSDEHAGHNH